MLPLKLNGVSLACLNQSLQAQIYPQGNISDITNYIEREITEEGVVNYTMTKIQRRKPCVGNVLIINGDKHSVARMHLTFSKPIASIVVQHMIQLITVNINIFFYRYL